MVSVAVDVEDVDTVTVPPGTSVPFLRSSAVIDVMKFVAEMETCAVIVAPVFAPFGSSALPESVDPDSATMPVTWNVDDPDQFCADAFFVIPDGMNDE